ncbi:MAG: 23S rRNA (uracil(1939)-C(5))-methyltransferase RlmD, partial [Clostridiaceae bacterium]|nr:23S rRNA (uracil(1939)-C(5))-methyltransferase RlmD [Clostridiaceae bacterium]
YKRCGGCSLQHMTYTETLRFKKNVVIDNLTRIGGLPNIFVHDTVGMEAPYRYRNKAQYPVGIGKTGIISGFYAQRTHEIINTDKCEIQHPMSDIARSIVLEHLEQNNVPVYDEATGKGLIRHIVTRIGFYTGQIMVIIVATSCPVPESDKLVQKLKDNIQNLKSVILNINPERGNVVLGNKNITLYGKDYIEDRIGDLIFEIPPLSFYQANPVQTEILYKKALEYAQLNGSQTVWDIYCGIGTIGLFTAKHCRSVLGVELIPEAIEAAKRNAARNNINNAEFYTGKAEKVIPELYRKGMKADVIFVDPPRKGCDESLLRTLVNMEPSRIVYISCNPSPLARDLKYLSTNGYIVHEAQPVDMFPWSYHVEVVCKLSR